MTIFLMVVNASELPGAHGGRREGQRLEFRDDLVRRSFYLFGELVGHASDGRSSDT